MVTVEMTGVVALLPPPLAPPLPLPPQPETSPSPITLTASSAICSLRRLLHPKRQKTAANVVAGRKNPEPRRKAAVCALEVIVRVVVAAVPEGVIVAGLKEQVTPAGSPEEQEKLIGVLKPL